MKNEKIIKEKYRRECKAHKRRYKAKKRSLKRHLSYELEAYRAHIGRPIPKDPPKRSLIEEILNSATHGIGAILSVIALYLMLREADGASQTVGAIIYFFGMLASFGMSCLYHAFPHGSGVKRLFRRFDYLSIYLLIGATFAVPILSIVGGAFGYSFFVIQWLIIAVGIALVSVFGPTRLRKLHIPLYVLLGWSALMLLPALWSFSPSLAIHILAGGVIYTLGIIPFVLKIPMSHVIWHFFVLAGALTQWAGIYTTVFLTIS